MSTPIPASELFQSFEDAVPSEPVAARVARLREALRDRGLDGFLIPHADAFQSEDVPPHARRLAWATGFTGSAGAAIVMGSRAALFVDGRYTLQAARQTDTDVLEIVSSVETPPHAWLKAHLSSGERIGFDPALHSLSSAKALREAVASKGAHLVETDNLVDAVWLERPDPPRGPIVPHPVALAGRSATDKLASLRAGLAEAGADAVLTNQGDLIAWTLNIRGADTARKPVPLAYMLLPREGRGTLFVAAAKLTDDARRHLDPLIDIAPLHAVPERLEGLGRAKVLLDPATATEGLRAWVEGAGGTVLEARDPGVLLKARKNAAELDGARAAHRRDGAAMCRFLAWLDAMEPGTVDEIEAATRLERCRRATGALLDLSFDTISGAGPNGAIVHYRVTRATNRTLEPGSLYLVDSGGQYRDGTTDVTRTVAIGSPAREMRERFTLVLKGHIAIATARFPKGTSGAQLDTLARHALWQAGLDYAHGTGHGVGSYLGVHEGPQNISRRGTVPLEAGMIVSNEPGYYKPDAYGIRIENLEIVAEPEDIAGGDAPMHRFETLTLVPIDRRLVVTGMLTKSERDWLNAYHDRVREALSPELEEEAAEWLVRATAPL